MSEDLGLTKKYKCLDQSHKTIWGQRITWGQTGSTLYKAQLITQHQPSSLKVPERCLAAFVLLRSQNSAYTGTRINIARRPHWKEWQDNLWPLFLALQSIWFQQSQAGTILVHPFIIAISSPSSARYALSISFSCFLASLLIKSIFLQWFGNSWVILFFPLEGERDFQGYTRLHSRLAPPFFQGLGSNYRRR